MSDFELIMNKLSALGLAETKAVKKAVLEHLEELDEIAAYDAAMASGEPVKPLEAILERFSQPPST